MTGRKQSDGQDKSGDSNGNHDVGFGRPPKDYQFKPGQSGNPKGRPKGSKSFNTYFDEELGQRVTLNENGTPRRMSKKQVLAKQLVNKALGTDPKVTGLVLDHIRRTEGPAEQQPVTRAFAPEDEAVISTIVQRLRSSTEPEPDSSSEESSQ
jgi:hypothetical protein